MNMIDIHTHVLPGIDDGAKDWDMCMQMLVKSAECGVKCVVATPHYLPWKKKADPDKIKELCEKTQQKLYEYAGITMDIYPGNEIYYHTDIVESLKSGNALSLAGSRYVLVEFSPQEAASVMSRAVQNMREAGYIPIIAHMERCRALRKPEKLQRLKEMGALFQMNAEVLTLGIFNETGRWSRKMLREGKVNFMASDMHNLTKRPPLSKGGLVWAEKKLNEVYVKELLQANASKVVRKSII